MEGIQPRVPALDLLAFLSHVQCHRVVPFRLTSKGTTSVRYLSLYWDRLMRLPNPGRYQTVLVRITWRQIWVSRHFAEEVPTAHQVWWIDAKSDGPERRRWPLLPSCITMAGEPG